MRVERDGTVGDLAAEQVNLRIIGSEMQMGIYRKQFADAAMKAARAWTFTPPAAGGQADQPYWVVRVPVDFLFGNEGAPPPDYGTWALYVPGPRTRPNWAADEDRPGFAPDALAAGVHLAGGNNAPKLLTPLDGVL